MLGDMLEIRAGKFRFEVEVLGLSNKRSGAPEAQKLYRETDDSRAQRDALAAHLRAQPQPAFKGRPTKRERRKIENFKAEVKKGGAWGDAEWDGLSAAIPQFARRFRQIRFRSVAKGGA